MRRIVALALLASFSCGCFRWDYALVKVKRPGDVALEKNDDASPRTIVASGGGAPNETIVEEGIMKPFGADTVARRNFDGSIEIERDSMRHAFDSKLVHADGSFDPIFENALPTKRSDTFWVPVQHPWVSGLALATPWSNVESVTIKREPPRLLGWFEAGMGAIALGGGGIFFAESYGAKNDTSRDVERYGGAIFAALGLAMLALGTWTLTTPTEEHAWAPPQ